MKTEIREIYKCDHCRKLYQRKKACLDHEKKCSKNPENTAICFGCFWLEKTNLTEYYDTGHGEQSREVNVFFCKKIESALFPVTMDPNKRIEFGYIDNQVMKKECEFLNDTDTNLF